MKPASWKSALRAATKVAFATSIVGCGGVVVVESADETDDETVPETTSEPTRTPPPTPEPIACEAPSAGWEVYDAATFDCCIASVTATLAEAELGFGAAVSAETEGCCAQLVVPNYDALWGGQPLAHEAPGEVIAACCDLRHGNAGCTPWGPPTPPAMDPLEPTPWGALLGGVA